MVLLFETLFRSPLATHHMLQLVLSSGLDICGLRLLYPQQDVLLSSSGEVSFPSEIPLCDNTEVKAKICKCTQMKSDVVLWAWGRGCQIYMSVALSVPISFPKEMIKDLGLFPSFCSQC